ncbi:Pimeloyl-ACP methyl ester carboxylesterase [Variovorax sp. HW608]|uniref:alpha/beta fold hydrolase n=1 Tax=Variovorax sp. HW608 TaxID=1034889 RepID=UPI00081FCFC2|nr:alpha/beta hydrolase [Variovorax sp. HW608]SCK54017.1 Pimeloyl-ACP methyl ester carboxylesterase [Variovorax sp. HW608]
MRFASQQVEMFQDVPFFREAGAGPGVVCIHSNASTSSQWRALTDRLSPRFRVLAADSIGAGKSPAWPPNRRVTLRDEVALLEPVFAAAGHPFFLVGHSYGAAVALVAALSFPDRIRAMVLYEPTLFAVLEQEAPRQPPANGIRAAADDAAASIRANDPMTAGERFIDYWMGDGAWRSMPEMRRVQIAGSMHNVAGWARALFTEPTPLAAFAGLDIPVLYMLGARSPPSTHGVARLLTGLLPSVTVTEFTDLGHMGPVTHPDIVNTAVQAFLQRN